MCGTNSALCITTKHGLFGPDRRLKPRTPDTVALRAANAPTSPVSFLVMSQPVMASQTSRTKSRQLYALGCVRSKKGSTLKSLGMHQLISVSQKLLPKFRSKREVVARKNPHSDQTNLT